MTALEPPLARALATAFFEKLPSEQAVIAVERELASTKERAAAAEAAAADAREYAGMARIVADGKRRLAHHGRLYMLLLSPSGPLAEWPYERVKKLLTSGAPHTDDGSDTCARCGCGNMGPVRVKQTIRQTIQQKGKKGKGVKRAREVQEESHQVAVRRMRRLSRRLCPGGALPLCSRLLSFPLLTCLMGSHVLHVHDMCAVYTWLCVLCPACARSCTRCYAHAHGLGPAGFPAISRGVCYVR